MHASYHTRCCYELRTAVLLRALKPSTSIDNIQQHSARRCLTGLTPSPSCGKRFPRTERQPSSSRGNPHSREIRLSRAFHAESASCAEARAQLGTHRSACPRASSPEPGADASTTATPSSSPHDPPLRLLGRAQVIIPTAAAAAIVVVGALVDADRL